MTRDGAGLRVGDRPYRVFGCNTYYLMAWAADPNLRRHVDEVLDTAVQFGLNTVRTWAFNDGEDQWNALQPRPGEHDERVLEALDYVVWQAGRRGLRLILALVNHWDDYGGRRRYAAWSSTAKRADDFYRDAACRRCYRHHARTLVERTNSYTGRVYRDDPTILAWELGNEPRCARDPSGLTLQYWLEEMSAHLKELDPNHLVGTGLEGFWGKWREGRYNPPRWLGGQGSDFLWNHQPDTIDLMSFHVYPDHWHMDEKATMRWIREHLDAAAELGKPAVMGEFGKRGPRALRERCFRKWLDATTSAATDTEHPAAAGALFWALYHDDYPDYDRFGVYRRHESTVDLLRSYTAR
ncbi:hypothetical protein FIV42_24985 [Persicimonas caeni]|uniref:mannan endo-1,4-beta-mannosidase n=1 Tax=Persicimonas caeni TaxID=2292766 RepID=A0A4Y6Q0B0_PERCE|nr:cellulase family glycosylhydrolase [Persicimonas caeni]QDG53879.1 hypothetical protein FIV42_24985 [Persicimonas caeni]QED35100.1 cellulase family glycosylhydrolase [Persicimonas caeni]